MSRKPGLHYAVTDLEYHADKDWLSNSGIKMLLQPGGPARFRHWLENGDSEHKAHFDEGHAAHAEVLGTGLEAVEIKEKDYNSAKAKAGRDKAYADGKVPLLTAKVEMVRAMGAVLRESPEVMTLLDGGHPEVSAYVTDPSTWTDMRARPDYLKPRPDGLYTVVDYKTARDASPAGFAKAAATYGYPIQEATYRRVLRVLDIEVADFLFLAQEKEPPYLWSLHENDPEDLALAGLLVERGIDIYSECRATGRWPGYGTQINVMRMSRWAREDAEEMLL